MTTEWIPGLPPVAASPCLATLSYHDGPAVQIIEYTDAFPSVGWCAYDGEEVIWLQDDLDLITAWMPLPQPYKEPNQ